jgi:protein TonB
MNLPPADAQADGDTVPVCVKDYAAGNNVISRVDPVFTQRRFNAIPVRIVIGKDGKVKHIHLISAFPDQAKVITDALNQWTFKPYLRNGHPVEVETGILFGTPPRPSVPTARAR